MILATGFTFIVEKSCTLSHSLTFILNLSLTKGIYINEWKCARVTPILNLETDGNVKTTVPFPYYLL